MPLPLPYPGAFSRGGGGGALAGTGYELWIIAGQSNAVSFAENSLGTVFPSGVLQVSRAGSAAGSTTDNDIIAAAHPLDSVTISTRFNAYNFANQFAIDWLADGANAGKTLVLLPNAEGGTSIASGQTWSPVPTPGTRLTDLVTRVNTFFTNYPGASLGGILWHQGESTAVATYIEPFELLRAYLIANCPRITPTTPWVVGGRAGGTQLLAFLAQQQFPNTIPYTAFADSAGTTAEADGLHFVEASLDIMGARYYTGAGLAAANDDVDLGYANAFGFFDFTSGTYTQQRATATSITDGHNILLPSGETLVRRAWQVVPAATFYSYTSYRVRFTAERDDVTDTVNFGVGANANLNSFKTQSLAIAANTPTAYDITFNTVGTAFTSGIFFGVFSTGPTATNVKITNLRVTRTIEE